MKLSVALLAKNAETHISSCLESVKWADEIVLLDGHSTDRTREIAAGFGARVLEKDFESFPAERQYLLERTSHDWILSLDADMIVPVPLAEEIKGLLARGSILPPLVTTVSAMLTSADVCRIQCRMPLSCFVRHTEGTMGHEYVSSP